MTNFLTLVRRELGVYFISPLAYIILIAILLVTGTIFIVNMHAIVIQNLPVDFQNTLSGIMYVVVLSSALVTMRLVAEEKSRGTIEIVLTAPVTEAQFILAKFAAAMVLQVYLVIFTLGFLVIIAPYGQVDWGAVACGYLGILLVGALVYSLGVLISSLCTSQIAAGVVSFMASVLLVLATMGNALFVKDESFWRAVLNHVDLNAIFGDFLKGVVDTSRLAYLLGTAGLFLFVAVRVVESRRWR